MKKKTQIKFDLMMDVDFSAFDFNNVDDYESGVKAIRYFAGILTLPGVKPTDFMSMEEYMFVRSTYEILTFKLFMHWAELLKTANPEIYQLYKRENLSELEIGEMVFCTLTSIVDKENN